jgi:flagellar hook-associated protein 1 FlgK
MAVRSDIVTDPSRFSTGQLTKLSDTDTLTKYTYQVSNASAGAAQALADLGLTAQSFEAAGELPNVSLTFSDYVAEIIGYSASKTADAEERARQEDLIKQGFVDRNQSIRGVNLDEELGNVIIFQNTYAANARVITVTKDLFEALLGAFQ